MLVASKIATSRANGPGARAVIWFQGCDARCPGCCNPEMQEMWSPTAQDWEPEDLALWFSECLKQDQNLRGVTLSGGEPLHTDRREEVEEFIGLSRFSADRPFDVMAFTGYLPAPDRPRGIDLLIAGPYDDTQNNRHGIVSSLNQRIVRRSDAFDDVDDDELLNGSRIIEVRMLDGMVTVTGLSSMDETLQILDMD
jgi:anaerobic ribonucleoside-triphosphate reductase activating protein